MDLKDLEQLALDDLEWDDEGEGAITDSEDPEWDDEGEGAIKDSDESEDAVEMQSLMAAMSQCGGGEGAEGDGGGRSGINLGFWSHEHSVA